MWWIGSTGWAHQPGLSSLSVDPPTVRLVLSRQELERSFPIGDLQAALPAVWDGTLGKVALSRGGEPCVLTVESLDDVAGDGIELVGGVHCEAKGTFEARLNFMADMEVGHRVYVESFGNPVAVVDASAPLVSWTAAEPHAAEVATRFLGLGVEHIWTGYDHLAFLGGLLLVGRSFRQLLGIATGFTIAHSITLSAAALGLVTLSPSVVEPLIALSILFVGIENLFDPPPLRRFLVTFALGLLHGFGFAGLLAELGLPRSHLALALVSFNGGVEVGQAVVVALALPLLISLRRRAWWTQYGVRFGSLAIAAAGLWWTVERLWLS